MATCGQPDLANLYAAYTVYAGSALLGDLLLKGKRPFAVNPEWLTFMLNTLYVVVVVVVLAGPTTSVTWRVVKVSAAIEQRASEGIILNAFCSLYSMHESMFSRHGTDISWTDSLIDRWACALSRSERPSCLSAQPERSRVMLRHDWQLCCNSIGKMW